MSKLHKICEPTKSVDGDVIFIHGLNGNHLTTWGFNKESSWSSWLSMDRPNLVIWSLEYENSPTEWTGSAMPFVDRAMNVLAELDSKDIGKRPLCFIAHSMGGLLVKQLLRHASSIVKEYKHICQSTRGVLFFSTPHAGSDVANLINYLGFFFRPSVAVNELRKHEPHLRELNLWYRENVSEIGIRSKVFYESKPTFGVTVVNATSADPGLPSVVPIKIDADHFSICCPSGRDDTIYTQTLKFLNERLPKAMEIKSLLPEDEISSLGQRFLATDSSRELKRILYETEAFLSKHPRNPDALMLRDEVSRVLGAKKLPAVDYEKEMTGQELRASVGTIFPVLMLIGLVLGAGGAGYGIYRLVLWLLGQ